MTLPQTILLAFGGFVLLVILLELAARLWIRRGNYYVFAPGQRLHLEIDLEQVPGVDALARFEINRDGERGPESPPRSASCYRVLTCGGSAAEGYLLDEPMSWAGALRGLLDRPETRARLGFDRVHVGSLGRSRTGAEAVEMMLDKTCGRYPRLQAIVIMVGASDLVQWVEAGANPSWTPPRVTVPDFFAEHPEVALGWSPGKLAMTILARRQLRRWLRPIQIRKDAGKTLAHVRKMRASAAEMRDDVPDATEMLDHYAKHLTTLLKRARSLADVVLVLGQPCYDRNLNPEARARFWDFCIGNAYKEEVRTYFSSEVAGELMAQTRERSRAVAAQQGAAYVDLGKEIEPALDLYYDFLHFTPKGAALVAAAIERELLARP